MSERIEVKHQSKKCYDIVLENSFDRLKEELTALHTEKRKLCIVCDSNVAKLYAETVREISESVFEQVEVFTFAAGEENKQLCTVEQLYEFLIEKKFNRKDLLAALGGGVTGDLCGFGAATYMRGIDFIQIPTTLLSQVDSSIGGKTGVDFNSYKNMIGAFHMPKLVYINTAVLNTLDERQFASGMAEVLKAGLLRDGIFYEWLITHFLEIDEKDPETIEEMISRSVNIKRMIVEKDPCEKGDRALLNLGHTIGHAIEKYMNFKMTHGECVALGCFAAAYISKNRNLLSTEECYEIRDMLVPFHLPLSLDGLDTEEVLALTKSDKKASFSQVNFILLKKIGKAFICSDVTDDEIRAAIEELKPKL